jgi:dihydrofolate synthase/folylpolyglutamate synthase
VSPIEQLPTNLAAWLDYIEALHPKSIAMGLDRVNVVKQRLNLNPQFPIVIVAGTNGKGSTCAMLEHIYHAAGYSVGTYSSPHLLRYNERVRLNSQEVSDEDLVKAFVAVEQARQDTELTYFEYGTLAAVWHLMQKQVDVAILEVGLGGRLDAVNVFEPDSTIVTSIDLDHMEFLGDTRECIGAEKAGVFRVNIPAICGDENPPNSLIEYANRIGAPLKLIGRDFKVEADKESWAYRADQFSIEHMPMPTLIGDFQLNNAACVLTTIQSLQHLLPVQVDAIETGLKTVKLAGRFQSWSNNPDIILDVAHNPHAAKSLAINLKQSRHQGKTIAVFAMLADKDITGVIQALSSEIDAWYVSTIDNIRGAAASSLSKMILDTLPSAEVKIFNQVVDAFHQACIDANENDRIITLGSFFTVAEVMQDLQTKKNKIG